MTRHLLLAALALPLAAAAAPAQDSIPSARRDTVIRVPLDAIVAVVGTTPITRYDIQERVLAILQEAQQRGQVPRRTQIDTIARQATDAAIDEEIMLSKAEELKVSITDAELGQRVDQEIRSQRERFPSEAEFRRALAQAGLGSPEEYRRGMMDLARRQELIRGVRGALQAAGKLIPVNVSDEEVSAEFDRIKGIIPPNPARVEWRQIVIAPIASAAAKNAARVRAESLLAEVRATGDFERVARRESMDPRTKDNGGDRGWSRRGAFEPEYDALLFGPFPPKPGEAGRIVETGLGYHIVRVDRVQPGEVRSRHILIRPQIDSADVARTRALVDSLTNAVRSGTPLDSFTRRYHDYAGREDAGLIPAFPIDSLPEAYSAAFDSAAAGAIVSFAIPGGAGTNVPKFVIAQVLQKIPGGPVTLAEAMSRLRSQMSQEGGVRRYLDNQRKEMYVIVRPERVQSVADAIVAQMPPGSPDGDR